MRLRSLLFVPGDRPDRMVKALKSGASALILDLEDSVLPASKADARRHVTQFLSEAERSIPVFVRVNPLNTEDFPLDLEDVLPAKPDGVMLPKSESAASVSALAKKIGQAEIPILPIATETPRAVFGLGTYDSVAGKLCGLTWGAEDLPAAIGATGARDAAGLLTPPYQMVRALALFAAHAAGVPAIETVYPDIADLDGLAAYAAAGRRDGFSGMMAIHPTQIPVINAAFEPTAEERARAQAIVDAFAAAPTLGAVQLEGKMIDRPHVIAARRLLES